MTKKGRPRLNPCPKCGGQITFGFGLAGGGYGVYWLCLDCDWFDKPRSASEED